MKHHFSKSVRMDIQINDREKEHFDLFCNIL